MDKDLAERIESEQYMGNYWRYKELYKYHKDSANAKLPTESIADTARLDKAADLIMKMQVERDHILREWLKRCFVAQMEPEELMEEMNDLKKEACLKMTARQLSN